MKIKILEVNEKQAYCDLGTMKIWIDKAMLKQYGIKKPVVGKTYGE